MCSARARYTGLLAFPKTEEKMEVFKRINLDHPITSKGQTFSKIDLRRPRVKDLRHLNGPSAYADPISAQNAFLSSVSELPTEVFEEMDLQDYQEFTEFVETFTVVEKKRAASSTPGE